jgi:hypothetical protein
MRFHRHEREVEVTSTPWLHRKKEPGLFTNITSSRVSVFNHTAASGEVTNPLRSAETNGYSGKAVIYGVFTEEGNFNENSCYIFNLFRTIERCIGTERFN